MLVRPAVVPTREGHHLSLDLRQADGVGLILPHTIRADNRSLLANHRRLALAGTGIGGRPVLAAHVA